MRIFRARIAHAVFSNLTGFRIELPDVSLEDGGEPDVSLFVSDQAMRAGVRCLERVLAELSVFGSSRPSLLAICSVTQSAPSGLTAGSCGRALGVGMSYSLMDTFSAPVEASSVAVMSSVSEAVRLRRPIIFSSPEIDRGM